MYITYVKYKSIDSFQPNVPAEASINVTLKGDVTEVYKVMLRAFVVTE